MLSALEYVFVDFTKDPADSCNFTEGQEDQRLHSSVVVHQLKHVDASLVPQVKEEVIKVLVRVPDIFKGVSLRC